MANDYTLEEAREFLTLYKDCEHVLASGQAKSYKIGTREFTALDLADIERRIRFFTRKIEALTGKSRSTRAVRVVPRDL